MNVIEPSLRQLVKFSLKSKYGDAWVDHFLKYLQPGTQEKIEAMGAVSSERILEETYLSELIATINGEWKLFENIFKTRATFREYGKDLCDIARSVSDHRKYQICAEDYKYVKADEASHWFQERLS